MLSNAHWSNHNQITGIEHSADYTLLIVPDTEERAINVKEVKLLNITFLKKVLNSVLIAALAVQVIGCGTLLYPERRGQTSGDIDPAIAILDGIGLIFFIVPGLVAFAIDFTTGAIYLPANRNKSASKGSEGIRVVYINPHDLSQQKVEEILAEQMGYSVHLNSDDVIVSELARPEEFMERYNKLVESGQIPE